MRVKSELDAPPSKNQALRQLIYETPIDTDFAVDALPIQPIRLTPRGQLIMLTDQRAEETATPAMDQWDAAEEIIDWSKDKQSSAPRRAGPPLTAELIESVKPNEFG